MRFAGLVFSAALSSGMPPWVLGHGMAKAGDEDHLHEGDEEPHHSLRGLHERELSGNPFSAPPGLCKDDDPKFTVGKKEYACEAAFNAAGGQCRTPNSTAEEVAARKEKFKEWKEAKEKQKPGKGNAPDQPRNRRLNGCDNCINWDIDIITIPVAFHIIHDGTDGRKYTCEYTEQADFTEPFPGTSDCNYAKDSIKVMNTAFRGEDTSYPPHSAIVSAGRSYVPYATADRNTRMQFCLQEATSTDNSAWYADETTGDELAMKQALRQGGKETLNIWVNTAGGYFGYAYFACDETTESNCDPRYDGVVILNDSTPYGDSSNYNEGDTLTHEVGHWLNLEHTHYGGCKRGPGDYMNPASNERKASYQCPVNEDTCNDDGGPNPIHNFMSYTHDSCMDEFSPGQKEVMQMTWETYRHKSGYSEYFGLDTNDDVTCTWSESPPGTNETPAPTASPTSTPTSNPTGSPTREPTSSPTSVPTSNPTSSPMSLNPTESPTTTPTRSPSVPPTKSPTNAPVEATDPPTTSPSSPPSKTPTKSPTQGPMPNPGSPPTTEYCNGFTKGGACKAEQQCTWFKGNCIPCDVDNNPDGCVDF